MAEEQTKSENKENEPVVPLPRSFAVPGNDLRGYIGVAPEYMTYANPNDKAIITEEEAYLYTDLPLDAVRDSQEREVDEVLGVQENEAPAIAKDTAGQFSSNWEAEDKAEKEAAKEAEKKEDEAPAKSDDEADPAASAATPPAENVQPTPTPASTKPAFGSKNS